jgi:hypothetical protein
MNKIGALCLLTTTLGCAAAAPFEISDQQRKHFEDVVRDAEATGAAEAPSLAAERLADAKSEFEYAQHLPLYPDRARALADKAQADAETALQLAQAQARTRDAAREVARHALVVGAVTP